MVLYLLATDWMILVGSFAVALYFRKYDPQMNIISRHHIVPEMLLVMLYAFALLGFFSLLGLYKRKILLSPLRHFVQIAKASTASVLLYLLAKSLLRSSLFIPSRMVLLQWGILLLSLLIIHRLGFFRLLLTLLSKTALRRRIVVIGDTPLAQKFIEKSNENPSSSPLVIGMMDSGLDKPKFVHSVPFLGTIGTLPDLIEEHQIEGVVICNPNFPHERLINIIEICVSLFGWVDIHTDHSTALQESKTADTYFDIPFIRMHGISDNLLYRAWKRTFDFSAALVGVTLISPLLIGTAIAIKLTSPGPVFYIKPRIGKNGKTFPFYKFRSMAVGADQDQSRNDQIKEFIQSQKEGATLSKVVNTAYVTPVGKFIRKWAIDELPQLFNVLKGEMALVGPRPVPPSEYEMEDDWHRKRFRVTPGCTGLWKIHAVREGVTFNDTVLYDIYYSRNMNPALDLLIIFETVWVILSGKADG
jgi:exopolysaccharide biosynthesis polyprenyl glycosylphosphotransferase